MDARAREEEGGWNYRRYCRESPSSNSNIRSIPAWEKRFCARVGLVPWRKLLAAKKYIDIYPNVVGWNDTAAQEAFQNAKARYWAQINGLDTHIGLPGPDAYTDTDILLEEAEAGLGLDLDYYFPDSDSDSDSEEEPSAAALDGQPDLCCNYGWDRTDDYDNDPERWRNPEQIKMAFGGREAAAGTDESSLNKISTSAAA